MEHLYPALKPVSLFVLIVFVAVNIMVVAYVTLLPKPAKAFLGAILGAFMEVAKAFAIRMAKRIATKFLTDFVEKVFAKFKIKNFLYYDQVLTNYYLTRYLADKISDPDLRQIYQLLNAAYVTGSGPQQRGGVGIPVPDRNHALLPIINNRLDQFIRTKIGGLTNNSFRNLPPNMDSYEYLMARSQYYGQAPSDSNISGSFGGYQTQASVAGKLEVAVGTGLKSSRLFGAHCENWNPGPYQPEREPTSSEQNCTAAGGTWVNGTGNTSFLTDPAGFVKDFVNNAINAIFNVNYDTANASIWTQIGNLLGDFVSVRLLTNTTRGVPLEEDSTNPYVPTPPQPTEPTCRSTDIDGDALPDVYDCDDGTQLCIYGPRSSTDPSCLGSVEANASESGGGTNTGASCTPAEETAHGNRTGEVQQAKDNLVLAGWDLASTASYGECGAWMIANWGAWIIGGEAGILRKDSGNRCIVNGQGYSVDIIAFQDGYIYDVIGGSGTTNTPQWMCSPPVDPGLWMPAIDPGSYDPASMQQGN